MEKPSIAKELEQLYGLLEKGALTQEEYDTQKTRLLNSSRDNDNQTSSHGENNADSRPAQPFVVENTATPLPPVPSGNNNIWLIIMGILVLVVIGIVAWLYMQTQRVPPMVVRTASETTSADTTRTDNNKDKLSPEELQKTLLNARKLHTIADIQLNSVWNDMDSDVRAALKKEQISWNRQKRTDCIPVPATQSTESEINRLSCETDMINERIDILNERQAQLLPRIKAAKLKTLNTQAENALAALNNTWTNLPDSVQQQLGQDYNQWAEQTNTRCTETSAVDSQVQKKIDYNLCIIKAVKEKNNELKGYQI